VDLYRIKTTENEVIFIKLGNIISLTKEMSGYNKSNITSGDNARWDMPPGWEICRDEATGWEFYVDHNTQKTTWTDPRINRRSNMVSGCIVHCSQS